MPLEVAIPLALSLITAVVIALRNLLANGAKAVILLAQLKENVSVCKVGIEALRMVDTDAKNHIADLEQKIEDLERYLELASAGQYPHPYTPRGKGKRTKQGHERL